MTVRTQTIGRNPVISWVIMLVLVVVSFTGSLGHASDHGNKHNEHGIALTPSTSQTAAVATGDEVHKLNMTIEQGGDASKSMLAHTYQVDSLDFADDGDIATAILAAWLTCGLPAVEFEYHAATAMKPDDGKLGLERPPRLS